VFLVFWGFVQVYDPFDATNSRPDELYVVQDKSAASQQNRHHAAHNSIVAQHLRDFKDGRKASNADHQRHPHHRPHANISTSTSNANQIGNIHEYLRNLVKTLPQQSNTTAAEYDDKHLRGLAGTLELLQQAGIDISTLPVDRIMTTLPSMETLHSVYGNSSSIVVGMDRCEQYRKDVPLEERYAAVAGLFNTGTNALGTWKKCMRFDSS
jgi:hypothetical protein